jgi:hypothetical protein
MKSIINYFNSILQGNATNPDAHIVAVGFKQEAPHVQAQREAAIKKMKEIGRASMLEGGKFHLHNTCLVNRESEKQVA